MLTEDQVAKFRSKGFLLGEKILFDEQVETLRSELTRVIENHEGEPPQPVRISSWDRDGKTIWQIVNIWEASEPFRKLMFNQKIVEVVAQLTAADQLRIWHDQIQYKPAETGGTNMWHQDWPYWPILSQPTQVTAWIALDDVDESNGCMSMVCGSYRWGNQIEYLHTLKEFTEMPEHFEGQEIRVEPCLVPRGYVHFHHALTWHGSHGNSSGRPRRAIAYHYMTQDTRYVESGDHCMKPYVDIGDGKVLQGEHFPKVFG